MLANKGGGTSVGELSSGDVWGKDVQGNALKLDRFMRIAESASS